MNLKAVAISLVFVLTIIQGYGQFKEFSVASYNSLRYSPNNIDDRHPDFRLIMNDLKPDVLLLEELSGSTAGTMFLDSVLNIDSVTYSMATFVDGNDLDIACYYKMAKFDFIETSTYPTQLRDIYQFTLLPKDCADTLHLFGVHLKASSGSANEASRLAEVDTLRKVTDAFPIGSCFIIGGDFNIYKSTEPAYQKLLQPTAGREGHFVDTIKMTGTWNNAAYAQYHTQSPRTTQFNGGANGGLDDRFDLLLMSRAISKPGKISYVANSMYAYGNDGQHYNMALTDPPANTAVSQALTNALHYASDHLPVVASFNYQVINTSSISELSEIGVYVSNIAGGLEVFNPQGRTFTGKLVSMDGREAKHFDSGNQSLTGIHSGVYLLIVDTSDGESFFEKVLVYP